MGKYEEDEIRRRKKELRKQVKEQLANFQPEHVILIMGKKEINVKDAKKNYKFSIAEAVPPQMYSHFIKALINEANLLKQKLTIIKRNHGSDN